jgi:hypothetical protein
MRPPCVSSFQLRTTTYYHGVSLEGLENVRSARVPDAVKKNRFPFSKTCIESVPLYTHYTHIHTLSPDMSDLTFRISSKDVLGDPLVALQRASVEIAAHRHALAEQKSARPAVAAPSGGGGYRAASGAKASARAATDGAATRLVDEMLKGRHKPVLSPKRSAHVATTTRK